MSLFAQHKNKIVTFLTVAALISSFNLSPVKIASAATTTEAVVQTAGTTQTGAAAGVSTTGVGANATTKPPQQQNEEMSCGLGWATGGGSLAGCAAHIAYLFLTVASWFLWAAAIFFNASIDYGLNMTNFINDVPIVDVGWTTFRDLTSIFFVFIILYIGISTIIGNSSYGIKSLLGKVIIAAIMINFSLFITKVIIDTSNVVALQFYAKITESSRNSTNSNDWDGGISAQFANAMGLQTLWKAGESTQNANGSASLGTASTELGLNASNLMVVGFGGSIFLMITAAVFVAGGIMFVIRSLVFVFLMILSPLAFVGGILPSTKSHAAKWWDKLFKNAIYAPVYLALMYAVMSMVLSPGKLNANFIDLFSGSASFTGTVVSYVILNALMLGCILVANNLGATGASWATSAAGKSTFGLAGWMGRNSVGRLADRFAESDFMKNRTSIGGRAALRTFRSLGGASYDMRNSSLGGTYASKKFGLGSGADGGFRKGREDSVKAKTEFGKSLNATGQRAFSSDLASRWGRSNKKASEEILKAALSEEITKHSEQIKELEDNQDLKDYERLAKKNRESPKKMSDSEIEELARLKKIAEGADVKKYNTFDSTTGTWTEQKDKKYLDPSAGNTLANMKKARTEAQAYLRNKGWKKK